jgi:hypothetical protein
MSVQYNSVSYYVLNSRYVRNLLPPRPEGPVTLVKDSSLFSFNLVVTIFTIVCFGMEILISLYGVHYNFLTYH